MASAGRKWFIGCGVGCGFLLLSAGGIGTCGYFGVRKVQQRVERLDAGYETLVERFGRPDEFVPAAGRVLVPEQVFLFLAVREDLAPSAARLDGVLRILDGEGDQAGILHKIRSGLTLLPDMFDFIEERNAVLARHGMGLGEYLYVYSVAYYAWLGYDPADGPSFTVTDHEGGEGSGADVKVHWGVRTGDGQGPVVRERRRRAIAEYVHGLQVSWLRSQRDAAAAVDAPAGWQDALAAQSERLARDEAALLWRDGLPDEARHVLEPFRAELEQGYLPMLNVVEIGLVEHD